MYVPLGQQHQRDAGHEEVPHDGSARRQGGNASLHEIVPRQAKEQGSRQGEQGSETRSRAQTNKDHRLPGRRKSTCKDGKEGKEERTEDFDPKTGCRPPVTLRSEIASDAFGLLRWEVG